MPQPEVCIKLNWALRVNIGAAYCFQLEFRSTEPPSSQTAKLYDMIPNENFFARLEQQHEIALFCLVQALKLLDKPHKVKVLASSHYLEQTLEMMPSFVNRGYLEEHRYRILLKQLWGLMQQHQIEYLLLEANGKALAPLRQEAEKILQEQRH